jgi:hypothetical protein
VGGLLGGLNLSWLSPHGRFQFTARATVWKGDGICSGIALRYTLQRRLLCAAG